MSAQTYSHLPGTCLKSQPLITKNTNSRKGNKIVNKDIETVLH